MSARRRSVPQIACVAILLQAGCLTSCAPVALLAALLGGGGGSGGGSGHAPGTGALDGSPSAIQNGLPADTSVQKALSLDQSVKSACVDELPKQAPPPEEGCTTRQTCVPGVSHPILLRMCVGKMAAAQMQSVIPSPPSRAWDWDPSH
jgi:hypothetical protein